MYELIFIFRWHRTPSFSSAWQSVWRHYVWWRHKARAASWTVSWEWCVAQKTPKTLAKTSIRLDVVTAISTVWQIADWMTSRKLCYCSGIKYFLLKIGFWFCVQYRQLKHGCEFSRVIISAARPQACVVKFRDWTTSC